MEENAIFIHIPKTGGTTINAAMQDSYWQTKPDFHYRHILRDTKKSNSGDIFEEENFKKYSHFNVIMMLRHPVDRAVSEYYFMKERKEFISLLQPMPKNFSEFVNNRQTHNYVVSFLLGEKLYSKKRPQVKDLEQIKKAIETIPIHVGIFEHFGSSLELFSKKANIAWKKSIEVKRMTFIRPKAEEISEEIRSNILKYNSLDLELYNFCLEKFNSEKSSYQSKSVKFNVSKYNHVLPYMYNYPFFGFCMENTNYINQNINFFKQLSHYLIDTKRITDGKQLTRTWNATFINVIKNTFPETGFFNSILKAYNDENDPLKQTYAIAKAVDIYLNKNKKESSKYYKTMKFDELLVITPKKEIKDYFDTFHRFFKK